MIYIDNPLPGYKFDLLSTHKNIHHFITTRKGGVSKAPYESLNLSYNTNDNSGNIAINRSRLASYFGLPLEHLIFPGQIHHNSVRIVEHTGNNILTNHECYPETDAIVTQKKDIVLCILAADCVPVLLFDPVNKVIAAVHAGWRGTVKKITYKTVFTMKKHFHCHPEHIIAGIGPSISRKNYQVGEEVVSEFRKIFPISNHDYIIDHERDKWYINLWEANKLQLKEAGLLPVNIEIAGLCTYSNNDRFYSARAGKGNTGRFASCICLRI